MKEKKKSHKTYIQYKNGKFMRNTGVSEKDQEKNQVKQKKCLIDLSLFKKKTRANNFENRREDESEKKKTVKEKKRENTKENQDKYWIVNLTLWVLITIISLFSIASVYMISWQKNNKEGDLSSGLSPVTEKVKQVNNFDELNAE